MALEVKLRTYDNKVSKHSSTEDINSLIYLFKKDSNAKSIVIKNTFINMREFYYLEKREKNIYIRFFYSKSSIYSLLIPSTYIKKDRKFVLYEIIERRGIIFLKKEELDDFLKELIKNYPKQVFLK